MVIKHMKVGDLKYMDIASLLLASHVDMLRGHRLRQ